MQMNASGNSYKYILSVLAMNNNKYSGFMLYQYSTNRFYLYFLENATVGTNGTSGTPISSATVSSSYYSKLQEYNITMSYDYYDEELTTSMSPAGINDTDSFNNKITSIMQTATVTVGGNGINSNYNYGSYTIKSFSVTKG